jgi:hypothetical protein
MRIIFLVIIVALFAISCLSQNTQLSLQPTPPRELQQEDSYEDFEDKVLNSFFRYSAFLSLNIISDEYNGRIIIENKHLFLYLNKLKGFNKDQYKAFMKDVLLNKSALKLKKIDSNFIKIKEIESAEIVASKGKQDFIKQYFKNSPGVKGVMKAKISEDEFNAIIAKLFDWKIAAMIDDETGYLVIY